jgi:hypothetical protein
MASAETTGGSEGYIYQGRRSRRRLPNPHILTTTELYVRLIEAEREGRLEVGEGFAPGTEAKKWVEAGDFIPDGFARIRLNHGTYRWFIEADEDTEDDRQMFAKLKRYADAYDNWPGAVFPGVLFVVPTDERKDLLERWVKRQPKYVQEFCYVATMDEAISTITSPDGN